MLTLKKVKIFKEYKGYYDGYYIQTNEEIRLISDDEWFLLTNLMQDIYLIRNKSSGKSFENSVKEQLEKNCDNIDTINLIFEIEKCLNGLSE